MKYKKYKWTSNNKERNSQGKRNIKAPVDHNKMVYKISTRMVRKVEGSKGKEILQKMSEYQCVAR